MNVVATDKRCLALGRRKSLAKKRPGVGRQVA